MRERGLFGFRRGGGVEEHRIFALARGESDIRVGLLNDRVEPRLIRGVDWTIQFISAVRQRVIPWRVVDQLPDRHLKRGTGDVGERGVAEVIIKVGDSSGGGGRNDSIRAVGQGRDVGGNHSERFAAVDRQRRQIIQAESDHAGSGVIEVVRSRRGSEAEVKGPGIIRRAAAEKSVVDQKREIVIDAIVGRVHRSRVDNRNGYRIRGKLRGRIELRKHLGIDRVIAGGRSLGQDVVSRI